MWVAIKSACMLPATKGVEGFICRDIALPTFFGPIVTPGP